jgi:type IV pilus assembly protein PilE
MHRSNRGFTLIEIMIVIAIIGIVMTIAAPSFTEYLKKGRRAEVVSVCFPSRRRFSSASIHKQYVYTNVAGLSTATISTPSPRPSTDQTFLLTAVPARPASMATDKCGDFTLTNTGVRSMNNATAGLTTKDCWGR